MLYLVILPPCNSPFLQLLNWHKIRKHYKGKGSHEKIVKVVFNLTKTYFNFDGCAIQIVLISSPIQWLFYRTHLSLVFKQLKQLIFGVKKVFSQLLKINGQKPVQKINKSVLYDYGWPK